MSDYFRPQEKRLARKDHRCIACLHVIPKGESYTVQSGYYDGSAFRNKFHDECWDVLCEQFREFGDSDFIPGDFEPPERITKMKDTQP